MESDRPVLAIYDFRSKQEYIYRTNRMREITGASELIARMYDLFIETCVPKSPDDNAEGGKIFSDWDCKRPRPLFKPDKSINLESGEIGIVVYEGGGNLVVLYKNRQEYINANKVFSRKVIKLAHSLSMITACVEWPRGRGVEAFDSVRKKAFERSFDRAKRAGVVGVPTNVLPYTLVDRMTFQPIVDRVPAGQGELIEVSSEALCKRNAFTSMLNNNDEPRSKENGASVSWEEQGKYIDDLGTQKGEDSLIAVLYFDGNSIGERVRHLLDDEKDSSKHIETMRKLSAELHNVFVKNPTNTIREAIGRRPQDVEDDNNKIPDEPIPGTLQRKQRGYRIIIDHGDEITLVCNAHAAPLALDAYFKAIAGTEYKACGGIAFCHTHDPFSEVYRVAEECCEMAKKANRKAVAAAMEATKVEAGRYEEPRLREAAKNANASYVDFHFVRSGITGSLEQIRENQEAAYTARPYKIGEGESYGRFVQIGSALAGGKLQRSDVKALNRAIMRGDSWYRLEYARLRAKSPDALKKVEDLAPEDELRKRILFDVTSMWDVFDVRFYC